MASLQMAKYDYGPYGVILQPPSHPVGKGDIIRDDIQRSKRERLVWVRWCLQDCIGYFFPGRYGDVYLCLLRRLANQMVCRVATYMVKTWIHALP